MKKGSERGRRDSYCLRYTTFCIVERNKLALFSAAWKLAISNINTNVVGSISNC